MGNSWQKLVIGVAVSFLVFVWLYGFEDNAIRSAGHSEQLPQQMLSIMDEKIGDMDFDIQTNRVHIYARAHQENFASYDGVTNYLDKWNLPQERMNWERYETGAQENLVGTFTDHTTSYTEKVSFFIQPMAASNDHYEVYTIYEASYLPISIGDTAFSSLFGATSILSNFDTSDIFLQIKGTVYNSDALTVQRMGQKFVEAFSAEMIEELQEETFVSLSARTPHWENGLLTNEREMNLQVALRANETGLGGETTVTIGTPLITTEY